MPPIEEYINKDLALQIHDHRNDNSLPMFSVIVATFNASETIAETILNVRNQAEIDYEIIVADGGSADGTAQIIESLGSDVDCWFSAKDSGIYDAWNRAISLSRGRYFIFLGAGDKILKDALSRYSKEISKYPLVDLWVSKTKIINNGRKLRVYGRPWEWGLMQKYMCVAHTGSVHSRKLFETYGLFDPSYKICGDYELLLRAGPSLLTNFVDFVACEMAYGGISNQSTKVFIESSRAKKKYQTRSSYMLFWDSVYQPFKYHIRRMIDKVSSSRLL